MKIGIITDGLNMIPLFNFLNQYDFEYTIYWDWNNFPYGEKDFDFVLSKVEIGINKLIENGVEKIILPPIFEILLKDKYPILPLFEKYLLQECLNYSLVGKIGFLGDYLDLQLLQDLIVPLLNHYKLTENQLQTKKFHKPFVIWSKQVTMWKYYLLKFGFRNWMINKTITHDLRYFKDAGVDTLVPLNYGYMAFDTLIKKKLNFKSIRFHGLHKLKLIFENIIDEFELKQSNYLVSIIKNGNTHILDSQKKWQLILNKGKK